MRLLAGLLLSLLVADPAWAGDLTVAVKDAAGQPVADAVVTLAPAAGAHGPIHFPWPYVMAQQGIAFRPFVLIVPVGANVAFPNRDKVRHHVYSFSPAKTFQLKLYGQDESRSVLFDKPGIVALGCNIHDRMIGFIDVVETPYAAKTDASGQAVLTDVPAGGAAMTVWRPFMKTRDNRLVRQIVIPARGDSQQSVSVELNPPPIAGGHMHMG